MSKILFIDDEIEILKSYKRIFEKEEKASALMEMAGDFLGDDLFLDDKPVERDFDVHTASQGQDGVNLVKEAFDSNDPFKVVFIDMRMPPGINGLETAKLIKQIDPKIEIVIVTAYSDISFKDIANELGSPDKLLYLKKPFDAQEIKQFANNLVVKHHNESIKDDFISNVSHELKTPLASIIGFQNLIASAPEVSEETKEYIDFIGHSAKLMNSLISELLLTVELQRSELVLGITQVNALEFFERCFHLSKPSAALKKNVDYEFFASPDLEGKVIAIDELRIEQCFNNLLSNALKFTSEGEVKVSLSLAGDDIVVEISDSGIGISEENVKAIFDKFSRVEDKHHEVEGLGLGLSIVRTIMDKHKARINVESELGKGSRFQMIFPFKEA